MDPNTNTHDAAAIIEAVTKLSGHEFVSLAEGVTAIVLPSGKTLTSIKSLLNEYRAAPERIVGTATALSAQSFADYVNRFKRAESAIFVKDDADKPSMLAVIDFHSRNGDADQPRFGKHRALYSFPLSDEMKAWRDQSRGGAIGQEAFATFLQDRSHDIANPPVDWMAMEADKLKIILDLLNLHDDQGDVDDAAAADALAIEGSDTVDERYLPRSAVYKLRAIRWGSVQRLLAMARSIEIAANGKATAAFDPKTGARSVSFVEENEARSTDGRKIHVPDGFFLNIPVFEAGPRHLMPVRLRYRVQPGSGKVLWALELVDPARMVRLAVRAAAGDVAAQTSLPIYYGAPEA